MKYILALDQGTTSSRAIVFNEDTTIHSMAQEELTQIYPRPGWIEHDPHEIWSSQIRVASNALKLGGLSGKDIAAIGVANQRETTVVWDRSTGEPIYNAIVWQDRRTAEQCDQISARGLGPLIKTKTGLVIDPYFSATKLQWILQNIEGSRRSAEAGQLAFGNVDSWLLWNLTGGNLHATDVTNASRTMLANIHTGYWDPELLEIFDVPSSMLPEIGASSHMFGHTRVDLLGASIPIGGLAGDQQAALLGQACTRPGMVKTTYGTGCFVLMYTGESAVASRSDLLTTVACQTNENLTYALEGSIFSGGATVQWLRDGLGLIESSAEVEKLALQAPDSGGLYLVPAFAGLGAPHWDPYARGLMIGLTGGTGKAHLARAVLDSIAHQSVDVVEAMVGDSAIGITEMRVDGGAAANNLLMQTQSDLLGIPVVRPCIAETTALGAAYLAGLSVGYWESPEKAMGLWQRDRDFTPQMEPAKVQIARRDWLRALDKAKGWARPTGGPLASA